MDTRDQQILKALRNHPLIAFLIVCGAIIIGIAQVFDVIRPLLPHNNKFTIQQLDSEIARRLSVFAASSGNNDEDLYASVEALVSHSIKEKQVCVLLDELHNLVSTEERTELEKPINNCRTLQAEAIALKKASTRPGLIASYAHISAMFLRSKIQIDFNLRRWHLPFSPVSGESTANLFNKAAGQMVPHDRTAEENALLHKFDHLSLWATLREPGRTNPEAYYIDTKGEIQQITVPKTLPLRSITQFIGEQLAIDRKNIRRAALATFINKPPHNEQLEIIIESHHPKECRGWSMSFSPRDKAEVSIELKEQKDGFAKATNDLDRFLFAIPVILRSASGFKEVSCPKSLFSPVE